ncbi:MAG: hypothetical protein KAU01_00400 [Candidatus Cloacimonetes bacterium]|nr:hypothetical protein [Candidatus Cloacimonadota bacterium]
MNKRNNNKKAINNVKFKFLSDAPLKADQEQLVRFGHKSISENLKQIILNCPKPFTIGLFAKWGTGKTTIINLLREKLNKHYKSIEIAYIDVWKYEKDSLRRQLLITLDEELNLKLGYKDRLNQTLTESDPTKGPIKFDWGIFFNVYGLITFLFVIAGFILRHPEFSNIPKSVSDSFLGFGVIGFLIQFTAGLFKRVSITVTEHRTDSAEGFERRFKEEILCSEKIKSKNKLLIIIDNLDRCHAEKAVELLSTLKTFLAKDTVQENKCIFLIACDDEAIEEHLKSVYGNSINTDEFLRKFFNTFQRIPNFIDIELQTYTEDLLKETCVPQFDNSDVAYTITSAFRENPRQIKRFINTLLAHFLLAMERESGLETLIIPKGTITNNIAFLAKLLIIRQQFPTEYKQLQELHLIPDSIKSNNKKFNDFKKATKPVSISDVRPFIYLKQSEEELSIPGIKELELAMVDNKVELIKERLETLKTHPKQIRNFERCINSLIDRNKNKRIQLFNLVSSSLTVLNYHNMELNKHFYDIVADLLNDDNILGKELPKFEPSLIFFEVLKRCNKYDRDDIIKKYINILIKQNEAEEIKINLSIDYAKKILKEFFKYKDWIDDSQKIEIRQALNNSYYFYEVLSLFKNKPDLQEDFLSEETISKFVSSFSDKDVDNKKPIMDNSDLLLSFKENISTETVTNIINKFRDLLNSENSKPYREEKENLLKCIENIINNFKELIIQITEQSILISFVDSLIQGVNALGDFTQKKIFILTFYWLFDILNEPKKSEINNLIINFFNNADTNCIEFVFNKLSKEENKILVQKYEPNFRQRVLQQQTIFDFLYSFATKDIKTQWFIELINSTPQRAFTKLDEINYKLDNKIAIVDALLKKAAQSPIPEKETLYKAVNKMKCANDRNLRDTFSSKIKALLKNTDIEQQKCGYNTFKEADYLSETTRRSIVRETIDWLYTLSPNTANQSYSIEAVIIGWSILPQTPQRSFIDFVFEKLIKNGINVENIKLGYQVLYQIKPKYEEYSTYFEDVNDQAKSESDLQIKSQIMIGLKKLRPISLNKKNKKFWLEIEKHKE